MAKEYGLWSRENGYWYYIIKGKMKSYVSTGIQHDCKPKTKKNKDKAIKFVNDIIYNQSKTKPLNFLDFYTHKFTGFNGTSAIINMKLGHIKHHIIPYFENKTISEITIKTVRLFHTYLKEKGLSFQTIKHINSTLKLIFEDLLEDEIIQNNPVVKPKKEKGDDSKKKDILNEADLVTLFPKDLEQWCSIWKQLRHGVFGFLLLTTGMRRNEGLSLKWNHIKYSEKYKRYFIILDAVLKADGTFGKPKNNEIRAIPIPNDTVNILNIWREKTAFSKDEDFIFPGLIENKPMYPSQMSKVVQAAFKKAELYTVNTNRNISCHSFRHTYVSIMKRKMKADALQSITGHKTASMLTYYDGYSAEQILNEFNDRGDIVIIDNVFKLDKQKIDN